MAKTRKSYSKSIRDNKSSLRKTIKKTRRTPRKVVYAPKDLDKQIDINNKILENESPDALCKYAENNEVFHMNILIINGVGVNEKNINGDAPLHCASYYGNKEAITLLLNKGANMYLKNNNGKTPLNILYENDNINTENIIKDYSKNTLSTIAEGKKKKGNKKKRN